MKTDIMTENCKNCGTPLTGRFCVSCGEKTIEPPDLKVSSLFIQFFSELTSLDSKLLRSVKSVLVQPGSYTRSWAQGPRKRIMKPLALFLLFNFIYFFAPLNDTFKTTLFAQYDMMPYSSHVKSRVDAKLQEKQITFKEYEAVYNPKTESAAKSMLLLFAVLMTPWIYITLRGGEFKLFHAGVLALEYMVFHIIINNIFIAGTLVGLVNISETMRALLRPILNDMFFTTTAMFAILWFFTRAARYLRARSYVASLGSAVIILFGVAVSLYLYRFILFIVTMQLAG